MYTKYLYINNLMFLKLLYKNILNILYFTAVLLIILYTYILFLYIKYVLRNFYTVKTNLIYNIYIHIFKNTVKSKIVQ